MAVINTSYANSITEDDWSFSEFWSMGSLGGHILPGSFFLIFGLWSCCNIFQRYFLCLREATLSGRGGAKRYRNTLLHPCSCCCRNLPFIGIMILAAVIIGMIGELVTAFKDGHFVRMGNAQHMTMYFFFGVMAVVNILDYYRFTMLPKLDYLAALLALSMEALLFAYHLHNRAHMDIQVHVFLLYLILGCIVSGFLEMVYSNNVVPAISRAYFVVLQGTWFYHVGFILYPSSGMATWDLENHDQMMIVTMLFTWHFAAVFLLFSAIGAIVSFRVRLMSRINICRALELRTTRKETNANGMNLNNTKMDIEQTINMISDTDEEEL